MNEYLPRGDTKTRDILATCEREILPTGDFLYTSVKYLESPSVTGEFPFQMLVSPDGVELLNDHYGIICDILDNPQKRPLRHSIECDSGVVVKERVGRPFLWGTNLAIKYITPEPTDPELVEVTCMEQFSALRSFGRRAIATSEPKLATRWALMSKWIHGDHPYSADPYFQEYLRLLEATVQKLRQSGEWQANWDFDGWYKNYITGNRRTSNWRKWFIAIDPIKKFKT